MKKVFSILLCMVLIFATGCGMLFGRKSEPIKPHLIEYSQRDPNPVRHIKSAETMDFDVDEGDSLHNQLADLSRIVVTNEKQPVFKSWLDPKVKQVYDTAISILDRYIKNSFSDFERIHAIHDYLTYYIEYDEDLYLSHIQNPDSVDDEHDSFELTGVFLNKKAVCDGYEKAFRLLCAIEGIKTETIEGSYNYNGTFVAHAWNKVLLDGVWYNIDTTQDSIVFKPERSDNIKVIHHGYFLVSDYALTSFGGHSFSGENSGYSAMQDYDFHSTETLFEGTNFKMQVNSADELNAVFNHINQSKRKIGQVELKLNLGLSSEDARLLNAYESQITAAYALVPDKDFTYNPALGMYPFQKYPNGVFVFLIYK